VEGHIHKTAKIDKNCEIEYHIVICERAVIGAGCRVNTLLH
jgi:UDP-3-O-[3-hydroxymyristoyl] glucosamine N-acyltransferase